MFIFKSKKFILTKTKKYLQIKMEVCIFVAVINNKDNKKLCQI